MIKKERIPRKMLDMKKDHWWIRKVMSIEGNMERKEFNQRIGWKKKVG